MNLMGASLKNLAGGSLEKVLEKLTTGKNQFTGTIKGFSLGTAVTAIIQSSAATTIMLIGFVNAGIMKLGQAIPVVFGANIGSTATAQILRLGDLSETSFILKLLKPSSFAPILICIGAFIILFTSNNKKRDVASILVGLGILFLGMNTMEGVFAPLKESESFQNLFTSFNNPLLGILIGLVLTAIIQSSSASVGILQAISSTGVVTYGTAIPIIIGQNIGKCMTIILGGIGANKKAKRVSLSYLMFNIFGAVFFVVVIYGLQLFIDMPFMAKVVNRGNIANVHFMFNFITSLILLPFSNQVAKITGKIIKDEEESKIDKELATLDPRLIATPAIAISQARNVMFAMADCIRENFDIASKLISEYNEEEAAKLEENEDFIDKCESSLNNFLLKVTSQNNMSRAERLDVSELLNSLSDMERIGDHCENLLVVSRNIHEQKISFSDQGMKEIEMALKATANIIDMTLSAFKEDDLQAISRIEPLAQTISEITELIKDHHVIRLQVGECGIPGGFALVDILTSLDRIGSHCKNIGLHIAKKIRGTHMDEMHGHIYITGYKTSEEYKALYVYYSSMYEDPIAENFDNSLREMTTDYEPAVEEPAVAISDSDNLSDGSAVTVPAASDKPKQKDKSSAGQDGKKKSSAKSKAAEKHEKIKQKIDGKYSGKNSKNSKKK
ncbi:Na/Pi cotransporter family protein [Coprococcus eutactus]|uniref:Na/Pi cotransporter family protein n=1 Tax=Coprococcus eutactus TaxID=33043 RepID=A0A3R5WRS0_9FIRM|nr:Na/Pi cotransporter family protein [Coprococcus eutactus]